MMGTPDAVAARTLIDALGLPITPEEYMAAVDKIYEEIFPKAELMPGAERLVRHLHAHGIPMAIATSSKPASFGLKMSGYRDLLALFHHVVCSGGDPEVKHGKPHPDIFLIAASRFEEKPSSEKVLVFEDSPMGVTAALAASMQVVMTPEPRVEDKDRRKATLCLDSLMEFKPELFGLPPFNDSPKKSASQSGNKEETNCIRAGEKKQELAASAFKPVSHIIFDLDGVILDTEKLYTAAAEQVTARYGHKFTWELKQRMMGTPDAVAARTLIDALGLPITPEEYMAAVDKIYEEIFPNAELMPGAEQLVRHLHAHGIPMAIATSSKPLSFGLKMSQYRELVDLFHHVVCSGGDPEVKRGKPHPDIFLIAASKFEGKPPSEKVLVVEDSPMGVTAALAAGMQVVMTPEPRVEEKDRRKATLCLDSLVDFKPELFGLPPLGSLPQQS
ncbi:putative pseudouridine-5'-phosphatase isoform X2 [Amblyomma americanum]